MCAAPPEPRGGGGGRKGRGGGGEWMSREKVENPRRFPQGRKSRSLVSLRVLNSYQISGRLKLRERQSITVKENWA